MFIYVNNRFTFVFIFINDADLVIYIKNAGFLHLFLGNNVVLHLCSFVVMWTYDYVHLR